MRTRFADAAQHADAFFVIRAISNLINLLGLTISKLEMATAQRTRPRAVVGAPRRAAWQPKSVLRHSVSVAPRTIIFYIFFTIIASELICYVQQW